MSISFGEALRRARMKKGYTQQQLAGKLFVDRSSIAGWETGRRIPDALMITRLSECLDVDVSALLRATDKDETKPVVIVVDDDRIILTGSMSILEKAMPNAQIVGFDNPYDALGYAKTTTVSLAFLDIEMGNLGGMQLCGKLLELNPHTNVIYLTSYVEYSFDAWATGACGFMLKPLGEEDVAFQLSRLRYPVRGLN